MKMTRNDLKTILKISNTLYEAEQELSNVDWLDPYTINLVTDARCELLHEIYGSVDAASMLIRAIDGMPEPKGSPPVQFPGRTRIRAAEEHFEEELVGR